MSYSLTRAHMARVYIGAALLGANLALLVERWGDPRTMLLHAFFGFVMLVVSVGAIQSSQTGV